MHLTDHSTHVLEYVDIEAHCKSKHYKNGPVVKKIVGKTGVETCVMCSKFAVDNYDYDYKKLMESKRLYQR